MLDRINFDFDPLINEILDQIPEDIWKSDTTTFLDPAFGGGQFLIQVINRLRSYGHSDDNISSRIYGFEETKKMRQTFVSIGTLLCPKDIDGHDIFTYNWNGMKFDVIIGNPPYQDGTKSGGQNKIYNQFSKKCLNLLKSSGFLALITPSSVCKRSKRFSLCDVQGLKVVSFLANNYFDVGVNICYWIVDKTHTGDVIVYHSKGEELTTSGQPIFDYGIIDKKFSILYDKIRLATSDPKSRMFYHNAIDMTTGRSSIETTSHIFPIYKLESDGSQSLVQYNKVKPKLHNCKKMVIPITKTFNEKFILIDEKDYDMTHVFVDVDNNQQIENIKSFIFSSYFREVVNKWKQVDGYGYNYALLYLPKFDKNKSWSDSDVKYFLEKFQE